MFSELKNTATASQVATSRMRGERGRSMRTSSRFGERCATARETRSHSSQQRPRWSQVESTSARECWPSLRFASAWIPPTLEAPMKGILKVALLCALLWTEFTPAMQGQTAADSAAIRTTALDYIDGWYTNNPTRMERALHPHLAKRLVWADSTGRSHLVDLTALELIQGTRSHPPTPANERRHDVSILSSYGNVAMVRIEASDWVDFLQEVKWNGDWKIINVVWENRPQVASQTVRR